MGKLIAIPSDSPDNNSDSDSDLNVLTDEPERQWLEIRIRISSLGG